MAFPEDSFDDYDNYLMNYSHEYYFSNKHDNNFWSSFGGTDLPKQHVKDFLTDLEEEWEPKPGDLCLVDKKGPRFESNPFELEFLAKTDFK